MKNLQKGFVVPLLIAIIALLVIGGGIYVYENKKTEVPTVINTGIQQSDQVQQQTNTQTSPVTTQANTSNWKIYTNTKYGFSIQYPAGSQIKDNLDTSSPGISFTLPSSSGVPSHIFYVYVATKAWYNLSTPNKIFKSPANCDDFSSITTSSININGVNFTKGDTSSASAALRSNSTEYCAVRGGIAYKLSPSIQYGPSYGDATQYNAKGFNTAIDVNNDPVFNQMVSTFKFTTPTSKATNLKTYTNSNPAFSFNYPSSWNQPVINQQSTRVFTDFGNGFSVTTGFYYDQVKGRNSTVLEIINGYKNSSTIKNVQTENIKVDGHLATKITYYGSDTKKNYTDVYIYQDQQIQEKFIELTADDSVDATIFNQIISTFKFTTQTI